MQNDKTAAKAFNVPCDAGLRQQVDNFRFENRFSTEAAALRKLISDGLAANKERQTEAA